MRKSAEKSADFLILKDKNYILKLYFVFFKGRNVINTRTTLNIDEKSLENVVFSRLFGGGEKGIRTHVRLPSNGFQGTSTSQKMTDFA